MQDLKTGLSAVISKRRKSPLIPLIRLVCSIRTDNPPAELRHSRFVSFQSKKFSVFTALPVTSDTVFMCSHLLRNLSEFTRASKLGDYFRHQINTDTLIYHLLNLKERFFFWDKWFIGSAVIFCGSFSASTQLFLSKSGLFGLSDIAEVTHLYEVNINHTALWLVPTNHYYFF